MARGTCAARIAELSAATLSTIAVRSCRTVSLGRTLRAARRAMHDCVSVVVDMMIIPTPSVRARRAGGWEEWRASYTRG